MATVKKKKLKSERAFLEKQANSDSYYALEVGPGSEYVSLKLADCQRTITWDFGRPGEARAKEKIAVIKKLIDKIYNNLHEVEG